MLLSGTLRIFPDHHGLLCEVESCRSRKYSHGYFFTNQKSCWWLGYILQEVSFSFWCKCHYAWVPNHGIGISCISFWANLLYEYGQLCLVVNSSHISCAAGDLDRDNIWCSTIPKSLIDQGERPLVSSPFPSCLHLNPGISSFVDVLICIYGSMSCFPAAEKYYCDVLLGTVL